MSGSVLQLNPPATYDPYAWQKKQAEAQGAEADTVQKQITNELANLNLQYKAAYQSEIIPGWGGQAPKVGNPLANANSGGFIGALGGAVKAGINALAPEAAPSGGNALALASPRRADPTLSTGPEGIVFPGSGIAMPKAWAMAAGADPEKAAGVLKEYQSWQRTTVSQAISSATDPQSWDTQVALLWKNGIITTQTAQQMSGKFAQREYLRDALAAPEAQMGNTLAGTQGGLARTPGGYVAGGPGPAAAGNVSRERTAREGEVIPGEVRVPYQVPDGNGGFRTEYRVTPTNRTQAANPQGMPGVAPSAQPTSDPNLPRGLRNNNPLNLEFVPGQGATKSDGRFGVYPTMEEGVAANVRQLASYANDRGLNTINGIVNRWAPPGENDSATYARDVARMMGVKPDAQLNVTDPRVMSRLVMAMGSVENKGQIIDPIAVQRGVQLGLQPRAAQPATATPNASPGRSVGPNGIPLPPDAAPAVAPVAAPPVPGGVSGPVEPTPSDKVRIDTDQRILDKDAEAVRDYGTAAKHADAAIPVLYNVRHVLPTATTGSFAAERQGLANFMETFGGDWAKKFMEATTGIDASKAGATQELIKQTLSLVTSAESQMNVRGGALMTNILSKAMPNINMQGSAIKDMVNFLLIGQQAVKDYAQFTSTSHDSSRSNFMSDPINNRYVPLTAIDQRWNDSKSVHSPLVYEAAALLLNGKVPGQAFKGLSQEQQVEALHIIRRADPNAVISRGNR